GGGGQAAGPPAGGGLAVLARRPGRLAGQAGEAMSRLVGAGEALVPTVVEETHRGERGWDLFSRLLKDRIVFLGSAIDDAVANVVIAQLLSLESDDPDRVVTMYVNSPGGEVSAGLAIYHTLQARRCPVHTYCVRPAR